MATPLTPTNLAPATGATVTTSNFMVSAALRPWPLRQRLVFQFATDAGFTANVHTATTAYRNPGAVSAYAGTPRLPQGTVYVRVRAEEEGSGDVSAWTAANVLTVDHPGSALPVFPGDGESVPWEAGSVTFEWEFRDTSDLDEQTAYRLFVEANDVANTYATIASVYGTYGSIAAVNDDYADLASSGSVSTLYDSTKITSSDESRTVTLPNGARNEVVRWGVQTWDDDDESGGVVKWNSLFVGDLPEVEITAPVGTVDTPMAEVTWTYESAAGHAQSAFQVYVYDATNGNLLHNSGLQAGAVTSYTLPPQVLNNGEPATIVVMVTSSIGMQVSASETVTPQWVAPPNPSFEVLAGFYQDSNRVDLEWFGAPQDPTFIEWRVYRRADQWDAWKLIGATQEYSLYDYTAPPRPTVEYAITQVGVAFGVQVESQPFPVGVDLTSHTYLLSVKDDPGIALRLPIVVGDDHEEQFEESVMDVIGQGRKAEVGTSFGRSGSLTVHFRDMGYEGRAAIDLERLREIKETKATCYLRVPFDETLEVHIGNLSVARVAGTVTAISDVTFTYTEVV